MQGGQCEKLQEAVALESARDVKPLGERMALGGECAG